MSKNVDGLKALMKKYKQGKNFAFVYSGLLPMDRENGCILGKYRLIFPMLLSVACRNGGIVVGWGQQERSGFHAEG